MRAGRSHRALTIALASLTGLGTALGQTAPPPGAVQPSPPTIVSPIQRSTEPEQPKVLPPATLPNGEVAPPSEDETPQELTEVKIEGATVYPESDLDALFSGLAPGTATRARISEAVRALQLKYRQDGYFLTKVTGSVEQKVLKVRVIEGYVSDVKLADDIGPAGNLVYEFLNKLAGIRPLRIVDLERYVLLAQNVPGITLRTTLRPAKDEPGAVELVAQVERKRFSGYIVDDNRGPKTVGPNEALLSVAANSMTSLGERSEFVFFNTPSNNEEWFGQLAEEGFVGSEGLKLRGYFGYGVLHPGAELRVSGYSSELLVAGIGVEYPFIRSRALSVVGEASLDFEDTTIHLSTQLQSVSDLRVLRLGGHVDLQDTVFGADFAAANRFEFKVHRGLEGFLGGTNNNDPNPARQLERNDFTKVTMEFRRTQDLVQWDESSLKLLTALYGQYTDDLLPTNEKLFLGGVQYGRGFYNGEITGDTALATTFELQYNDQYQVAAFGSAVDIGAQYYAFVDAGQAWNDHASAQTWERVASTGFGVRARITDYISFQLEGLERLIRNPTRAAGAIHLDPEKAVYFRIAGQI